MAKKEFKLTEIKKGYNIAWAVCSQCLFTGTITLTDNAGKVYFQYPKTNRSTSYQVLGQGYHDFTGDVLYLYVDIPESAEINQSITANNVTDSHAGKVGQVYSFCIEDSTDEDYNDFYINIVGWAKKG